MHMSVNNKLAANAPLSSLCETCSHGHVERGFRESEELVICRATWPEHRVQFRVRECSAYVESHRQSLRQMEEIAGFIEPRGPKREAGFVTANQAAENGNEIEVVLNDSE